VHARCGFIINTLRKKTCSTDAVRKDDEYCALCGSAAAAEHFYWPTSTPAELLLISSLTGFFAFRNVTSEGSRGASGKKFSRLAIARHTFRPPHKLCYNSTTAAEVIVRLSSATQCYYL